MTLTTRRIWSTEDGRLVLDGHPDAAFLRYGEGDQVHDDDAEQVKALEAAASAQAKQADPPADKQARPPANKSGSGLTVTRQPRGATP